jgi:transposase
MTRMHKYPSDISRGRFEIIRGDLESAKKTTRPRKSDLYDIFCAVLYLLKNGCSWRAIPSDFPKHSLVRYYYDIWAAEREDGSSLLAEILKKIGAQIPEERRTER